MSFFTNAKIGTRLIASFAFCSLITLLVGVLGGTGIAKLSNDLESVFTNNVVSIVNITQFRGAVIGQNRDIYRLLSITVSGAPESEQAQLLQEMRSTVDKGWDSFKLYRATSLHKIEKAAGEELEQKDWPALQSAINQAVEAIQKRDLSTARQLLGDVVQPAFLRVIDNINVMVNSNVRQADELGKISKANADSAAITLYGGVAAAFIFAMAIGLFITRSITRPIATAVASAQRVAAGDLTVQTESTRRDETGLLLRALADMQGSLKNTIHEIASASDQLASAAEELNAVTEESARGLVRQNGEIQQAATAVNEMTSAVEEVARNAVSTLEASQTTSTEALNGRNQVQNAVGAINDMAQEINSSSSTVQGLAEQVNKIGSVVDVIRGIAEQTNLLALNAAIEAARAGEQGRGFAVVADEVRALAHRTQTSTAEIENMISAVQSSAGQAVSAMGNSSVLAENTQQLAMAADEALQRITAAVGGINERNLVIATAAEEQAQVAREVDRNLVNIQDLSTQTATGANQTNASSQELSRLAVSFKQMVAKFRL